MRTVIKIILIVVICLFLGCCGEKPQSYDISQYLESFIDMDYETMYSLCAPAVNIKEAEFVQKYENIFEGLGVTEVTIDNLSGPDEDGVYTYTSTYSTEDYGDFTNDFTLRAGLKKGKCVVLWNYSLIFPEMEEGTSVRVKTQKALRGEIFGSDGTLIAKNSFADTIYMDTTKVKDISAVAAAVSPITGVTQSELIDRFNKAVENEIRVVALGSYFKEQLSEQQRQSILAVPGLGIDDKLYTPIRSYPLREAASHIAGYTGFVDEKNIPDGYASSDKIGLSGLEAAHESELRGKDGKIIYIENRWGKNIRTLYEISCEQGQDLWLSIKPGLQQRAYDALKNNLKEEQTGAAIVMDAQTGFVEAMASYPSFDNNVFTFPVVEDTFKQMTMFSYATQGRYPPGSVIKPFSAAAALEGGAISADTVFDGRIADNKWTPDEPGWAWKPITRVSDSGTPLKLHNALVKSDNIFFAFSVMRLGDEKFVDYLERIGMSESAPFDLPVKNANIKNPDTSMDRRLLADMGYGQGQLLVTPIQMAAMYTAFANGTGDIMKPVLVKKTCRSGGLEYETISETQPEAWIKDAVSKRSLDTLLPMMEDVIKLRGGTGRPANIPGIGLAGKTGTAEIGSDKTREISWFAAFWTDGNYKRLVVVMVDVKADEGAVKFDIAKELLTP